MNEIQKVTLSFLIPFYAFQQVTYILNAFPIPLQYLARFPSLTLECQVIGKD
jgi:hypothetical protein